MEDKDLIEALVSGGMDINSARRKARIIGQRKKAEEDAKKAEAKAKKTKPESKE